MQCGPPGGGIWTNNVCCQSFIKTDPDVEGIGDTCCNSSFKFPGSGSAFMPGWDAQQLLLSRMNETIASYILNATAAAPVTSGKKTDVTLAIGAGLGIPLGILALGLLGFFFVREKRKITAVELEPSSSTVSLNDSTGKIVVTPTSGSTREHRGPSYFDRKRSSRFYGGHAMAQARLKGTRGFMGAMSLASGPGELPGEDRNKQASRYARYEVPG